LQPTPTRASSARNSLSLDKVAPQPASMAGQGNQIDVVGNTDNEPIGPGRAQNRRTDLLLRPKN